MRPHRLVPLVGLMVLAAACSAVRPGQKVAAPASMRTVAPSNADFFLIITNQSFREPNVRLTVTIDDEVIADGPFAVEGQHNYVSYPLKLGAGSHSLTAVSKSGVRITETLTVPESGARYGVLSYWNYEGEPKRFTWEASDTPPMFG